ERNIVQRVAQRLVSARCDENGAQPVRAALGRTARIPAQEGLFDTLLRDATREDKVAQLWRVARDDQGRQDHETVVAALVSTTQDKTLHARRAQQVTELLVGVPPRGQVELIRPLQQFETANRLIRLNRANLDDEVAAAEEVIEAAAPRRGDPFALRLGE